jgi:hypothetical protein
MDLKAETDSGNADAWICLVYRLLRLVTVNRDSEIPLIRVRRVALPAFTSFAVRPAYRSSVTTIQ